jgi:hypothetical protein
MLVHLRLNSEQVCCGKQLQDIMLTKDEMSLDLTTYFPHLWERYIWCPLCTDHPLVQLKLLAAVDL